MRNLSVAMYLIFCLGGTESAFADQIYISGSVTTLGGAVSVNQSFTSVPFSTQMISSQSAPVSYSGAGYYARAAFGNLGLSYIASAACPNPTLCNQVSASGRMIVGTVDPIYVGGATTSDFL